MFVFLRFQKTGNSVVFQPSFTAIVFQCGGGLVSISIFLRAGFLFYISSTIRVSDVTLGSFWVPFRASSVFHCHGVLVWRRVVFSIGFSTTGKSWEKATFYRSFRRDVRKFLVRFRGLSVLPCHGVLVWRRAAFSTGFING